MQSKEELNKEKILSIFNNEYPLLSENGIKKEAIEYYKKNNFPNIKDEGWRQTNLSPIFVNAYKELLIGTQLSDIEQFKIPGLNANVLVFVNGFFSKKDSKIISNNIKTGSIKKFSDEYPEIFKIHFESTELLSENNFTALNTAFAHDGCFVYLENNQVVSEPIHILNISTGKEPIISQVRNLVVTGINSEVEIIETFHSLSIEKSFVNAATEVIVGKNSKVNWLRFQNEAQDANHMNHMKVVQKADSNFTCNIITLTGNLIRNNIHVKLIEQGCSSNLSGLYLANKKQLFDNYTFIEHAVPHCESNQVYKGIIDDEASAVFFGRVLVAKDAQKTNANQSNKNVLLSESAKINSKPQLEIYADDVACSHGSTTGQLDQEAMFYMQARGISKERARAMLLYGFVSEVINKISNEAVKEYVDIAVKKLLE